jgi:hypothetical protein
MSYLTSNIINTCIIYIIFFSSSSFSKEEINFQVNKESYQHISNFLQPNILVPGLMLQTTLIAEKNNVPIDTNSVIISLSPYLGNIEYISLSDVQKHDYLENKLRPIFYNQLDNITNNSYFKSKVSVRLRRSWDSGDLFICSAETDNAVTASIISIAGKKGLTLKEGRIYIRDTKKLLENTNESKTPIRCKSIGKFIDKDNDITNKLLGLRNGADSIITAIAYFSIKTIEKTTSVPNTIGYVITGELHQLDIHLKSNKKLLMSLK